MNKIVFDSPIGKIAVFAEKEKIVRTELKTKEKSDSVITEKVLFKAKKQFGEYFAGKRTRFELEYCFCGTDFQKSVWRELEKIPFGKTKTYGEVAAAIEKPKAARAVGMACNKNPLAIIVPCHRVLGAGGRLIGFACGTDIKEWLLGHEAGLKGEHKT
ncbi:MAG: methylated-DNA--[Oscillospiraceae bacterium]|nr:methylated-DNA--[protein]-cysteine S-methyltransferase [Oscillospiraceae bacterium]MBQ4118472.1 methylated-DNA--[protein]-cysteine S-methyltransferase [Oscillospiraceae bacterium]